MTEAELIFADILLQKFPVKKAINTAFFMSSNLLIGMQDKYTSEIWSELQNLYIGRNESIRIFLLQQDYLEIVDHTIPRDILTKKGEKAKELGGHQQYLTWEAIENRKKAFEEFPKKKWHIYDLGKGIILILIGSLIQHFFIEPLTRKNEPKTSPQQIITHRPNTDKLSHVPLSKKDSV